MHPRPRPAADRWLRRAAPPFSLVGIDHVVFLVDDLPRAVRWYGEVLGCQPGYCYPALGMEQLWCGAALIVLWDVTASRRGDRPSRRCSGGRNVDHVCLALRPFDGAAMRAHLHAHMAWRSLQEALHGGARGMGNSFYVVDPWGNRLELKGPAIYPDGRRSSGPPAAL